MPYIGSKQITDITFLDSLTGIAVANNYPSDSNYVLKTTTGGDSWQYYLHTIFSYAAHTIFKLNNRLFMCGLPLQNNRWRIFAGII